MARLGVPVTMRTGKMLVERAETFVTCNLQVVSEHDYSIKAEFCDSLSDLFCV